MSLNKGVSLLKELISTEKTTLVTKILVAVLIKGGCPLIGVSLYLVYALLNYESYEWCSCTFQPKPNSGCSCTCLQFDIIIC